MAAKKRKGRSNEAQMPSEPGSVLEQQNSKRVKWDSENSIDDPESDASLNTSERFEEDVPDEPSDFDEERGGKTYVAAACYSGRVAAAAYNPTTQAIQLLEDTQENSCFDLIKLFLDHVQPDVIITSWKADDIFIGVVRDHTEENGSVFRVRLAKDFVAAKGRERLLSLKLFSALPVDDFETTTENDVDAPSNAHGFMKQQRQSKGLDPAYSRWQTIIRLGSYTAVDTLPICMACVGALLDHIIRDRAFGELQDEGVADLEVRDIGAISLESVMQINLDALHALQVFHQENHASIHTEKTKEGLSLFAMLDFTVTALGRELLRTWLMRPSCSSSVIQERHDAITCFLLPENMTASDYLHSQLKGTRNIPRVLARLKAGKAKSNEWQALVKFTYHMTMLYDSLAELHRAGDVHVIQQLYNVLDIPSLKKLGVTVNDTIDWEESIRSARLCIRPHVDEDLDELKRIYNGIDSVLSKVAEQMWDYVPPGYVPSLNVVYFPQLGFLICTPMMEEWTTEKGIDVLDGWTFQFSSDNYVYFKSPQMHDLDQYIGDLHSNIVDREIEIVQALLEDVLKMERDIEAACDVGAELDCLLSFTTASRTYEYTRPTMVESDVMNIIGGRHPLQEQVVDVFVPNDLVVGSTSYHEAEFPRILVCTGANACGKSVYLKQAALIQIMAQAGCFVPAEHATLGITDKIFTRIQTRESVSRMQSAFMIDLNQASHALRNCTSRSLILLDEFGKGTLSSDGAGLFCGIVKHLAEKAQECPKVLFATHFYDVFHKPLIDPISLPIRFLHMEVVVTDNTSDTTIQSDMNATPQLSRRSSVSRNSDTSQFGQQITYLYRIVDGVAKTSHAMLCAQTFGIPARVTQRADYITHLLQNHEIGQLLDEAMSEDDLRELQEAEAICREFLSIDLVSDDGKSHILVEGVKSTLAAILKLDDALED